MGELMNVPRNGKYGGRLCPYGNVIMFHQLEIAILVF